MSDQVKLGKFQWAWATGFTRQTGRRNSRSLMAAERGVEGHSVWKQIHREPPDQGSEPADVARGGGCAV